MDKPILKSAGNIDDNILGEIVKRIVDIINPLKILIFGSYAYGTPAKHSDIDILVVSEDNVKSRYETTVKIYGALRGVRIPKDIVVATPKQIKEWENVPQAFITKIIKMGKVIYERKN